MTTLLIDNYDSFTWNLYQYLCELGSSVVVYRNDQISLPEIIALNPARIVISPGPGYPKDSGISPEVIKTFTGKVPILGVCLGEQAIFEVFGGTIKHAGEIVHGKTTPIRHDNSGVFCGIRQGIEVSRYHSLAGDPVTLPSCLQVSAVTDSGIIMGVRHKEFVVEGVQFHPESIKCEEGMKILSNFLKFTGGRWVDNGNSYLLSKTSLNLKAAVHESILDKIVVDKDIDIQYQLSIPGKSYQDLMTYSEMKLGFPVFGKRLISKVFDRDDKIKVFAEIKRRSPSKGVINNSINSAQLSLKYANAGASVISVLTESDNFMGSLYDLEMVRRAIDTLEEDRPALLRKDFIYTKYQVLESKLSGADMILLIVSVLKTKESLLELIDFCRLHDMEPLVEVNNEIEMKIAIEAGSKIIGVNNRNLHTFNVDMNTTASLSKMVKSAVDIKLIALSGISSRSDVQFYESVGCNGVLVGEALMKSDNIEAFIKNLRG